MCPNLSTKFVWLEHIRCYPKSTRKGDPRVDERLMIQYREHIEEHETDDTHNVRNGPTLESQLVAHVEPMMEVG